MTDTCVLCREPLSDHPNNLEHYVHQVLIRNFDKLCIPPEFSWALRKNTNTDPNLNERVIAPVDKHKLWATVLVHERCNSEMSFIGQDFKYVIDNIDSNIPDIKFLGIFKYYANLWNIDPYTLVVRILTIEEAAAKYSNKNYNIVYEPFSLSCGRIEVECPSEHRNWQQAEEDKVLHTIILGKREYLIDL